MPKNILVTGGLGYIGSHTVIELLQAGYNPVIIDNLSNSSIIVLERIKLISGKEVKFYQADISNIDLVKTVLLNEKIDAVIHFAASKAVKESVIDPLKYYDNNVGATTLLLQTMQQCQVDKLIFSSSATVYGDPVEVPVKEDAELKPYNPYGHTKMVVENMLKQLYVASKNWRIGILRYFNPVGAHKSGLIGEDPNGIPNNLMPYITQVAFGRRDYLTIFGNDYPTLDGTCIRDYIHVVDLALGHVKALDRLFGNEGLFVVNLGTGHGISVLDVVTTFMKVNQIKLPYQFGPRRDGDVPCYYANSDLACELLDFKTKFTLEDMCYDSFNWQKHNPNGFDT